MRLIAALVFAIATTVACGGGGLFKQYEYEEDLYPSLDGTATLYVNTSIAALDALRGASFDTNPAVAIDREAIRRYYTSPITHVTRVSVSRRNNRRFVHVRMDVDDISRLGEAKPFSWSRYRFTRNGPRPDSLYLYLQTIGPSAHKDVGNVGWTGDEIVAFRLHPPSKIPYHNAGPQGFRRGNILAWEQSLTDRLNGVPLTIDARMESKSILYTTLWLFGATFLAVALMFLVVIVWVVRRGKKAEGQ